MILHQTQKIAAKDRTRFRVLLCGRRWGKTTLAVLEMIAKAAAKNDRNIAYIAPTFQQARDIAWEALKKTAQPIITNANESRLEITLKTQHGGESKIILRGWEAAETLRGQRFDFVVIDEVASMRNFWSYWHEVIRPTLTDTKGDGLFISTPKGFNHFYNLYNLQDKDPDYKSFHFTSYDNPHIPKEEIDKAKQELTEDRFAQEYEADFRKTEGLIYSEFKREINVIEPIALPSFWQFYRAMDFGAVNPTVCLWVAVDNNDNVYVVNEYSATQQTTKANAEFILAKTSILGYNVISTYGDPSAEQEMLDYASYGLIITPATKMFDGRPQGWVNYGIEKVQELLKPNSQTGRPRLYIFKNCVNLIREFETYHWKDQKEGLNAIEIPEKVDDHSVDALRYFAVSYVPQNYSQYRESVKIPVNSFTGY